MYTKTGEKKYFSAGGVFENCLKLEECPEIWTWEIFEDMKDLNEQSYCAFTGANKVIRDKINAHWTEKNKYGKIKAFYWTGSSEEIYEQGIIEGKNIRIRYQ